MYIPRGERMRTRVNALWLETLEYQTNTDDTKCIHRIVKFVTPEMPRGIKTEKKKEKFEAYNASLLS